MATAKELKALYTGKKIKRLTKVKNGTFPEIAALKSEKDRALLSIVAAAKKVDDAVGQKHTITGKDGQPKEIKVSYATVAKAVELKFVEVV